MMPTAVPGGLPSEYLQVQYLESTGGQYIDTGYVPKCLETDEFVIDFAVKSNGTKIVFGTSGNTKLQLPTLNYRLRSDMSSPPRTWQYFGYATDSERYSYRMANHTVSCLGTSYTYSTYTNLSSHLYLFAQGATEPSTNFIGRIYSVIYRENGTDVLNLIPCIRIADSKPGMYDLVGRTFYTNAGTGEFIAGDPVVPEGYLAVEYLESGGTQYFWTDVEVQDGLTVESKQELRQGNDSYLFGGAVDSANNRSNFNGFYSKNVQGAYPQKYYNSAISGAEYGNIYTIKTTHENGVATVYVNGSLQQTFTRTGSVVRNGAKCVCFGARAGTGAALTSYLFKGKVYFIKVSKGNALLANYVPCVRTADDEPGMYDTVSKKFYTNEGTGKFSIPTT